ncbi:MAG: tetratricopeptide repeat protein [Thermodesulfobacteriota bacterium]|nr:tetratricopeptide repeat protein [Thermodesulfobacteriota bacterium]
MKKIHVGMALLFVVLFFSSCAISQKGKTQAPTNTHTQDTYSEQGEKADKTVNQGNGEAESALGDKYYYGIGVPKDYKEAAKWYRKAAEQGNALAQCSLGFMYDKGEGVPHDYMKAVE